MPFRCAPGLPFTANEEPSLDQILAEPLVRLLMTTDRVEEAHIRQLAAEVGERRLQAALQEYDAQLIPGKALVHPGSPAPVRDV
jgi:hypothetical protein